MTNEKGPGNLEFPSPEIKYKAKRSFSQEATFPRRVTNHFVRVAGSLGLFVSTLVSPIDSPKQVNADSDLASVGVPTLIDGSGNLNKTNYLILNSGATPEQIQNLVKALKTVSPYDKFEFNAWLKQPTRNLECNWQTRLCNWDAVNAEVDETSVSGIPIDRTIVGIGDDRILGYPRGGSGRGFQPSCSEAPTNHTPAVVVIPPPKETYWIGFTSLVAHEDAHTRCLGHNGGEKPDLMWETGGSSTNTFNEYHTNFLIQDNRLLPFSLRRNSFPTGGGGLTGGAPGGIIQLEKMELSLDPPIPGGTTGVKLLLQQEDGEEITMIYGSTDIFDKMRKGTFRVEELSKYILQPDQLVNVKVWVTNESLDWNSPNWENHLVRPNLRVPGIPWARTYRTPKVDSTTISSSSLVNGDFTTDNTPTLQWKDTNPGTFYYEVQLSGEPSFNMDPETATSFVYWNLVHGGMSNNSWTVPDGASLATGKYYWRLRPRIQGSGTPVAWTPAAEFQVVPTNSLKTS